MAVLALPAMAFASPMFSPPYVSYNTGTFARAIQVADFDGDADLDVAVPCQGSYVSVFFNDGNGFLDRRSTLFPGFQAFELDAADLDGDGVLDLVTANHGHGTGTVSVMMGEANGSFASAVDVARGSIITGVSLGDLTGDGVHDAVYVDIGTSPRRALLIRGNGDGSFAVPETLLSVGEPRTVDIEDLDGDGELDVVTAGDDVCILFGAGGGTFAAPRRLPGGGFFVNIEETDGDGRPDVVTGRRAVGGCEFVVYRNMGGGDFLAGFTQPSPDCGSDAFASDVNHDGIPDLTVVGLEGGKAQVFLGLGGGNFQNSYTFRQGEPVRSAFADMDADGHSDLLAIDYVKSELFVVRGHGDGTFGSARSVGSGALVSDVVSTDLDGDGAHDLATVDQNRGEVQVLRGNGDGTFAPGTVALVGTHPLSIETIDVNQDGRADLVTANATSGTVSVLINHGGLSFERLDYPAGGAPIEVFVTDLNGDGWSDLVCPMYSPSGFTVLLARDSSGFESPLHRPTPLIRLAVGDFNEDGYPDLMATGPTNCCGWDDSGHRCNCYTSSADLMRGRGDGTFDVIRVSSMETGKKPAVGDVNNDGHEDVLFAYGPPHHYLPDQARLLYGNGAGGFEYGPLFEASGHPRLIDIDGDGWVDLVMARPNAVAIHRNRGDGSFELSHVNYGVGPSVILDTAFGDVDGDGRLDIAFAAAASIIVLLQAGPGEPTPVLVSLVESRVERNRVFLVWDLNGAKWATAHVERREDATPWRTLGAATRTTEGRAGYDDRTVSPGIVYGYRLMTSEGEALGEVTIETPNELQFGIAVSPQPSRGRVMSLRVSVPDESPVRIEVLDVAGRRVLETRVEGAEPGIKLVDVPHRLAAGMYFLRGHHRDRTAWVRFLVLD